MMNDIPSPIDLIRKSVSVFFEKNNFLFFLKVYAILLPFSIITYFQNNYFNGQVGNITADNIGAFLSRYSWLIWVYIIIGVIYLLVSFWVSAAGILAVSKITAKEIPSVKTVYTDTKNMLWPYSLLLIVLALITGAGFILLIVPGVMFLTWYSFAGFVLITKGTGIKESMAESKKLVTGRFWKIFGRLVVFGLFTMLFQIVISLIPFGLGSIISPLFGALLIMPSFLLYKELSA